MEACDKIVTYWLCPAEPERGQLARLIRDLAGRFDAPVFEPHVTIHVTTANQEDPAMVLERVGTECGPYRLKVRGLEFSDKFTKTLFVQFAPDSGLAKLSEELRRASVSQSDYELNPHLSLLYKTLDPATKRTLAESIALPFSQATFDAVKAVLSPAEVESREDVEAWQVVAERKFNG